MVDLKKRRRRRRRKAKARLREIHRRRAEDLEESGVGYWKGRVSPVVLALANWCYGTVGFALAPATDEGDVTFAFVGIGGILILNGFVILLGWSKHRLSRTELSVAAVFAVLAAALYTAGPTGLNKFSYIVGIIAVVMLTGGSAKIGTRSRSSHTDFGD